MDSHVEKQIYKKQSQIGDSKMYCVDFIFYVEPLVMEVDAGYAHLQKLIEALKPALPDVAWYITPSNEKESKQVWPDFVDKEAFYARVKHDINQTIKEYPTHPYPHAFTVSLTSAKNEAIWSSQPEGRCTLNFSPQLNIDPCGGRIQLGIISPNKAWPNKDLMKWGVDILSAIVLLEDIKFANVDVEMKSQKTESYQFDFRTFPHHQFLGWMGFVPKVLTPQDIPEAAEVIPLPERHGSIVVAVGDTFDLRNPKHIKQAQQVEMRLVDLDALPVIDPDFQSP